MTTELVLMKAPGGALIPADEDARETVNGWKVGQGVRAKVSRMRNLAFHRKFFAMLNLGFDAWEPPPVVLNGIPAVKNFERFRKDVLIQAGFYELTVNMRGEARAEAKSISFGSMDEDEFEKVYSKVADVLLQKVLTTYTREDLDRVVEEMLGFVS